MTLAIAALTVVLVGSILGGMQVATWFEDDELDGYED